jgi:hypothetical protein
METTGGLHKRVPSSEGGGSCVGVGAVALGLPMGEIPTHHDMAPTMPMMALATPAMEWVDM